MSRTHGPDDGAEHRLPATPARVGGQSLLRCHEKHGLPRMRGRGTSLNDIVSDCVVMVRREIGNCSCLVPHDSIAYDDVAGRFTGGKRRSAAPLPHDLSVSELRRAGWHDPRIAGGDGLVGASICKHVGPGGNLPRRPLRCSGDNLDPTLSRLPLTICNNIICNLVVLTVAAKGSGNRNPYMSRLRISGTFVDGLYIAVPELYGGRHWIAARPLFTIRLLRTVLSSP